MVGAGADLFLYFSGWLDMPLGLGFEKLAQKLRYSGDFDSRRSALISHSPRAVVGFLSLVPQLDRKSVV